ncbi:MAG: hypothetical protein ACLPN1_19005 [Dissulfurispiraceae bacterium]|jgi:hypothetical protein
MLLLQAMKRNALFYALVASTLVCALSFSAAEAADNPALAIMKLYWNDLDDHDVINPYIVSILAMNEIEEGQNIGMVKQFIVWYLDSVSEGDKDGLSGTIYDFRVSKDGSLESTGDYDSVDGYAGAFLYLLRMYYEKTGDKALLTNYWMKIENIAYLIAHLQAADGLTHVTDKQHVKYLMDNAESYAGASAFISLIEAVGKGDKKYYEDVRVAVRTGIQEIMYDAKRGNYIWALNGNERFISNLNVFYPDAYANILLFAYDLSIFEGFPERKTAVWKKIISVHSESLKTAPIEQQVLFRMAARRMDVKK